MSEFDEYVYETMISQYDFIECMAQTSTGFLYKCLRKNTGENVAVRIITVFEMEELEEVIGELKSITRNESDYFGKIFDCFIYSSNLYLVMEYFENGSLMDAITRKKLTCEFECIALAAHLTRFLDHFHQKNIAMIDIKPSSLFITEDGKIKVFSYEMSQLFQSRLTRSKAAFKGSPYYLAPEIIQGGKPTLESDIWSLGVCLFEVITGQLPYRSFQKTKVLFEIVKSPALELNQSYSQPLRSFLSACLKKDPAQRESTKQLLTHSLMKDAAPSNALAEIFYKDFSEKDCDRSLSLLGSRKESISETHQRHKSTITTEGIFIPQEINKGSIMSTNHLLKKLGQISQRPDYEPLDMLSKENVADCEKNRLLLLKIKRSASKVEKLKPGLTQLIFREIVQKYQISIKQKHS